MHSRDMDSMMTINLRQALSKILPLFANTHFLVGKGNCLLPERALPAAFLTNAPGLNALADIDTEAAKARVTKVLFAMVMVT